MDSFRRVRLVHVIFITESEQVGSGDPTHLRLGLEVGGDLGQGSGNDGSVQTGQECCHGQSIVRRLHKPRYVPIWMATNEKKNKEGLRIVYHDFERERKGKKRVGTTGVSSVFHSFVL